MTVFLCDGSDYDFTRGPFDVAAMAADGLVGLTFKATEAASTKHVHLADALNRGRAAGLPVLGAYHVVRSSPGVAAQVAYFFAYLDSQVPWWRTWPGFILQADLERWSYDAVSAQTGAAFAAELRARKPASAFVLVYASKGQYGDLLTGIGSPLWNANYPSSRADRYRSLYPGDTGAGWAGYSGQVPLFWQFADSAIIGSQPGCDVNAYRGTLDQLRALITGGGDMWSDQQIRDILDAVGRIDGALAGGHEPAPFGYDAGGALGDLLARPAPEVKVLTDADRAAIIAGLAVSLPSAAEVAAQVIKQLSGP